VLLNNRGPSGDLPDVMVRTYGEGRIIVTADDYGCVLNESSDSSDPEDFKFAYNVLQWAQENPPDPTRVPEPSTILLVFTGIGMIGGLSRFRGLR
jgi:hypothetical protein